MIETVSDMISTVVMVLMALAGFYILFVVSDAHHAERMRDMEENYYSFFDNLQDEYEDSDGDREDSYFE